MIRHSYDAFSRYMVSDNEPIYEINLQHAWNNIPINKKFKSTGEGEIIVLSPGVWNREAGPDFLNAKISINNRIVIGDVEVHTRTSDWFNHGHHKDRNYDNVILHVIADNNRDTDSSPAITTMVITAPKGSSNHINKEKYNCGKCAKYYSNMDVGQLKKLFIEAGRERFSAKSSHILEQMLCYGADDAFWEATFEAIGYKNNKQTFKELFCRFRNYPNEAKYSCAESILWGESGLLPDLVATELAPDMEYYTKSCWEQWWTVRPEAHEPINWVRSGSRPLNSPERRVAALEILVRKFESPTKFFASLIRETDSSMIWTALKKELVVNHSLWDQYTNFYCKRKNRAAVLGESRVLDLCVNVVLPAVYAYARLKQDDELLTQTIECWMALPKAQNNYVFTIVRKKWFLSDEIASTTLSSAAAQQGVLHVYRNFCEANQIDCNSCLIVNSVR